MGSSGSGSFTDYSNTSSSDNKTGGTSGENRCDQAQSFDLEDVVRCSYYITYGLPHVGLQVLVTLSSRLVVRDAATQMEVGYIPTRFNYLAGCIKTGYSYTGSVTSAISTPIVRVSVDIFPV